VNVAGDISDSIVHRCEGCTRQYSQKDAAQVRRQPS
jgi:hypothetical protein